MLSPDQLPLQSHPGRPHDPERQRRMIAVIRQVETTETGRLKNVGKFIAPVSGPQDQQAEARKLHGAIVEFCRSIYRDLRSGMSRHDVARKYGFEVPGELSAFEKARRTGKAYAGGIKSPPGPGRFSQLPEERYGKKPPLPKGYRRPRPRKPKNA